MILDLKNMIEFQNQVTNPKVACNFPHYSTFEDRMKSFDNWPKSMKIKPKALSEAGFFYLGSYQLFVRFIRVITDCN